MRNFTILFLVLSIFGYAQNPKNNARTVSIATYTVCNPDSSGLFRIMYNDVYNVYGLYKYYRLNYYYNSNSKNSWGFSQRSAMNANDTIWTNDTKWTNTYDSNNNLIDSVTQYWNASGNYWADSVNRTVYVYDFNQHLISVTNQVKNNAWINSDRKLFVYNSANLLQSSIYQNWYYAQNRWFSYDSLQCMYDANNRLTNKYYYINTSDPVVVWNYYAKDTIHYNSSNAPIYLLKVRDGGGGSWVIAKQINWTYDSGGRILSRICNGTNSVNSWESDSNDSYAYDINGKQILLGSGGYTYFSNCIAASLDEKNINFDFSIFPNPSNSALTITSTVDYSSIKIINSIGKTVANFKDEPNVISVSDLSNGIYLIQLLDKKGNPLKTEKFIKE